MKSRAKTLDGDVVEGYYAYKLTFERPIKYRHIVYTKIASTISEVEVDPATLEYQIGDEWYSMEELEAILRTHCKIDIGAYVNRQEERKPFTYIGGGDNPPTCAECGSPCDTGGCYNQDCEHYYLT